MAEVAADITVSDEDFRAFLDRHPDVLRKFLAEESKRRSDWWVAALRREARIGSLDRIREVM